MEATEGSEGSDDEKRGQPSSGTGLCFGWKDPSGAEPAIIVFGAGSNVLQDPKTTQRTAIRSTASSGAADVDRVPSWVTEHGGYLPAAAGTDTAAPSTSSFVNIQYFILHGSNLWGFKNNPGRDGRDHTAITGSRANSACGTT